MPQCAVRKASEACRQGGAPPIPHLTPQWSRQGKPETLELSESS
jgi:hypothetical protein